MGGEGVLWGHRKGGLWGVGGGSLWGVGVALGVLKGGGGDTPTCMARRQRCRKGALLLEVTTAVRAATATGRERARRC